MNDFLNPSKAQDRYMKKVAKEISNMLEKALLESTDEAAREYKESLKKYKKESLKNERVKDK